jgi:hypothetical protein
MDRDSILVREVCGKNSTVCDFEAIIQTKAPIKEVYEIRHQILKSKVLLGKNAIALFGKIVIKLYCINSESLELFLSEQTVSYKGFILGGYKFHNLEPLITVNSRLEGIFTEIVESNRIKISGIISTELLLSLEKVIQLSQLENSLEDTREDSLNDLAMNNYHRVDKVDDCTVCAIDNNVDDFGAAEEIRTKVNSGTNQEITIILD